VLRRDYGVLRLDQTFGQITVLEILLRAQDGEIEMRNFDPDYLMPASGTFRIRIRECMTEAVTARIGMTLDNHHLRHS
jgi:hypothetical protein